MIFILNGFLIIANVFGVVTFVAIALETNCSDFESCLIGMAREPKHWIPFSWRKRGVQGLVCFHTDIAERLIQCCLAIDRRRGGAFIR